jgi:hypothetical protein
VHDDDDDDPVVCINRRELHAIDAEYEQNCIDNVQQINGNDQMCSRMCDDVVAMANKWLYNQVKE